MLVVFGDLGDVDLEALVVLGAFWLTVGFQDGGLYVFLCVLLEELEVFLVKGCVHESFLGAGVFPASKQVENGMGFGLNLKPSDLK